MKALLLLSVLSFSAFADQYPVEWSLRDRGYTNCESNGVFNKRFDCEQPYIQLFQCEVTKNGDVNKVRVVAVGQVVTDVMETCQPIVVYSSFIEEVFPTEN